MLSVEPAGINCVAAFGVDALSVWPAELEYRADQGLRLLVFRRHDDPRVRLDPGYVIMHLGDAGRVLRDHLEPVAKSLIGDRAGESDDAVRNVDAHARSGRPLKLVELGLDGGLDLGVGMGAVCARRRRK